MNATDSITLAYGSTTFDTVSWTSATFPVVGGAAVQLASHLLTAGANDTGSNWCAATSAYGSGDLGTPGAVKSPLSGAAPQRLPPGDSGG